MKIDFAFDSNLSQLEASTYLHCRVNRLGGKTVKNWTHISRQYCRLNICGYIQPIYLQIFVNMKVNPTNISTNICKYIGQSKQYIYKYWDGSAVYYNALLWSLIVQFDDKLSKSLMFRPAKMALGLLLACASNCTTSTTHFLLARLI